jgi:carbonic anhydrase
MLRIMRSAIDELFANAIVHESDFEGPRALIPSKHVTVVTCMDSRIDTFRIFGLDSGEAHILRNAGGLVTDDVLRSLVLSQRLLQTREVILMHHTNCGLHGMDEPALRSAIAADTGQEPPYAFGSFTDLDAAVRTAITRVREHPELPHRNNVRGFVYHTDTGHVREVLV